MAGRIQGITIKLKGDTSDLQNSLNQVYKSGEELNRELRQINTSLKFHPGNTDLITQKQRVLGEAVENTRKKLDDLKKAQQEAQRAIENGDPGAQAQYDKLTREILKTEDQLKSMSRELKQSESAMRQWGESTQRSGEKVKAAGEKIGNVGKTLSTRVTAPIVAAGVAVGKAAIDFESAFAGVRKTVDATEAEFAMLEEGIRQMAKELPASAVEIAGVAEAAGQLGIKTENILGFTRVMIDLGEATNMSAEEAATSLARLANITGMPQAEFDKLGSVVVDLGNNFATTEKEIVDLGLRLAGAGAQIGMTEAETMSFAAALSSVGIEAQAGGSAFSKVMIEMQLAAETGYSALDNIEAILADTGVSFVEFEQAAMHGGDALKDVAHRTGLSKDELKTLHKELLEGIVSVERFADVMGVAGDEFVEMFKSDPSGALMTFVEGLASAEDRGVSAIAVLDEMGITEVRLRDTLLRAAGASDLFSDAIATGTKAWEENTALTNEAEQRYQTMESQLQILKNNFIDVGISLGEQLLPYVEKFVNWLGNVADKLSEVNPKTMDTAIKIAALAAAIGPVLVVLGSMMGAVGSAMSGIGLLAVAFGGGGAAATAFGAAVAGLAGPVGIAVAAIAGIAGAAIALSQDALPEVDHFASGVSDATAEAVGAFLELEEQATTSLKQMVWSGQEVTAEYAETIGGAFTQMKDTILTSLTEQRDESAITLQEMFDNNASISSKEREKILAALDAEYNSKSVQIAEGEARVQEILSTASEEKRALTETEKEQINFIQEEMRNAAVQTLSESEAEQLAIMESLRANAGVISAQQAAEVVQNSVKQKDEAIAAANEEYEERLKAAAQLRASGSEEAAEMADKIVEEATRQRDEAVKMAESMHMDVVEEAKAQAGEHVAEVDWSTGEIKSKWEVMADKINTTVNDFGDKVAERFGEIARDGIDRAEELRKGAVQAFDDLRRGASEKMEAAREAISTKISDAKSTVEDKVAEMVTAGRTNFEAFRESASTKFGEVKTAVSRGLRNAYDTVTGWFGSFATAGSNIVGSIASGVRDAVWKVRDAINGVVSKIRNYLPFSPAKEGPLRDLDKLNFGGTIASSITKGTKDVTKAMGGMAGDAMDTLEGGMLKRKPSITDTMGEIRNHVLKNIEPLTEVFEREGMLMEEVFANLKQGGTVAMEELFNTMALLQDYGYDSTEMARIFGPAWSEALQMIVWNMTGWDVQTMRTTYNLDEMNKAFAAMLGVGTSGTEGMKADLEDLGTTAEAVAKQSEKAILQHLGTLKAYVAGNKAAFIASMDQLLGAGEDVWNNIVHGGSGANGVIASVINRLSGISDEAKRTALAGQAFGDHWKSALNGMIQEVGMWQSEYNVGSWAIDQNKLLSLSLEEVKAAADKVKESISAESFAEPIKEDAIKTVKDKMQSELGEIESFTKETLDGIAKKFDETFAKIQTSVVSNLKDKVVPAMRDALMSGLDVSEDFTQNVFDDWNHTFYELADVVLVNLRDHTSPVMRQELQRMLAGMGDYTQAFFDTGQNWMRALAAGIQSGMQDVRASINSMPQAQVQAAGTGVQWYDSGGIFRSPTVIGVGEKRPEFVGALDDLKAIVADVIDKRGSGGDSDIVITGNTFAVREEADIRKIAEELMTLADRKKRGGR